MTVRAFAKINLSLRIKGVRADGYHEVQTVLQAITLFDRVSCRTQRGPFAIRCSDPAVPVDRTNLVWRAAAALWHAAGRQGDPADVLVTLDKRIPVQAGLGGGSSDAAAALVAFRRLWKVPVSDEEMASLAADLGSDVPYFLVGGTALGLGRGEEIYRLEDLPPSRVVLAIPPFGVSTQAAYAWYDERRNRGRVQLQGAHKNRSRNDLEGPVSARHPLIGRLIHEFHSAGAIAAAMSGSGSTVFGVFDSAARAAAAVRTVQKNGVGVVSARFLPRRKARSLLLRRSIV